MNIEVAEDLARSIVLFVIFLLSVREIKYRKDKLSMIFFAMAIASMFFSDVYWMTYDSMRPETRMPFAANEICEWSFFALLGTCLTINETFAFAEAKVQMVCAVIFSAANVALWIGWSGEWLQDILTGAVLAYFLCALISKIVNEEAFTSWQWVLLGIDCVILIIGQTLTFVFPEPLRSTIDFGCYILLFATTIAFIARAIYTFGKKEEIGQGVCHAFASFAWVVITMYMSSGVYYQIAMAFSIVSFILMFLTLRREDAAV